MNTESEESQKVQPASESLQAPGTDDGFGPDREPLAPDEDPLAGYDPDGSLVAGAGDVIYVDEGGARLRDVATPRAIPMNSSYVHTKDGMFRREGHGEDCVLHQLANWSARVVQDVSYDDGSAACRRTFKIELTQSGTRTMAMVPLEDFSAVDTWAMKALGVKAQVAVGRNTNAHLRNAVQVASADASTRTIYKHSGWTEIGGRQVYLHAGGGIDAQGLVTGVEVELPAAVSHLHLPIPASAAQEQAAVDASLSVLDLASDPVMVTVMATVWRAPLGPSQLAVWVTGRTGAGKSEVTALAQQHFGGGFDARHLPAAWSGTGNSITELAYLAKDALLTVDDFVPKGPTGTVARLHATAEQVVRAQGNGAGRSRLDADSGLRANRPPRGTLLASGEDIPQGQSLLGRLLVVDLAPSELDFHQLTTAQRHGVSGVLAAANAGYIQWLAGQPARRAAVDADVITLREEFVGTGTHNRTASLVAEAALGWRTFIDYARARGFLDDGAAGALWQRVRTALQMCGEHQSAGDSAADPASRFMELVAAALSSGRAHLASLAGTAPPMPQRWGWRDDGTGVYPSLREQGRRIGWIEHDDVYLLPDSVLEVVRAVSAEPLALSRSSMAKRLFEGKLLLADELGARDTYTVRKQAEGRRQATWHFRAADLGVGGA